MPGKSVMDHDQRFKKLLQELFRELMELFWPVWAALFDFDSLVWLPQEIYSEPREGKMIRIDLVGKLKLKKPVTQDQTAAREWLALIHVEIESRESLERLRPQVYKYYHKLREKHGLPVLPLAMLLQVGLEGLGVDVYEEFFGSFRPLHFQYLYAGLPALDGEKYLTGDNWLGVALSTLMKLPAKKRAKLTAQALDRLVKSPENDWRKYLLCDCVDAYSPLTKGQRKQLDELLASEPFSGVRAMHKTWYEKGLEKGEEQGMEKGRKLLLQELLEKKFGPLPPKVKVALEKWPDEKLIELGESLWKANSLEELGLEKKKKK
jgi:hypothetical protein